MDGFELKRLNNEGHMAPLQYIREKASFPKVPKHIMARGQARWSEDLREIIDTAISTATLVEVAMSYVSQTRALYQQVQHRSGTRQSSQ
ncbi:hypothetical protein E2C01_021851 [Portunus trituberculatus]|uniref:Uncharacterized protein n=1 Tax=Portunus trituberculatus TaxID=210409 RepID=A0A5B7E3P5_PORTR|nr:hypothetical protein [Portunus trituberculatus]